MGCCSEEDTELVLSIQSFLKFLAVFAQTLTLPYQSSIGENGCRVSAYQMSGIGDI